jgi:hypothetical protein
MSHTIGALSIGILLAGFANGTARAADLSTGTDICEMNVNVGVLQPHVAVYTQGASAGQKKLSLHVRGTGAPFWWDPPSQTILMGAQMACGAGLDQAILAYRDINGGVRARDRRSGWAETSFGFTSAKGGLWGKMVYEKNSVLKFVLFIPGLLNNQNLYMLVWDDSKNPKWQPAVDLGPIPGGINTGSYLGGYAIDLGPTGQYQSNVSVFFPSNDGRLIENRGSINGGAAARSFVDHGLAPSNRSITTGIGGKPAVVRWLTAPVDFRTEDLYNKRVVVQAGSQAAGSALFARIQSGTGAYTWQQITSTGVNHQPYASGLISGCQFGFCQPITRTMGVGAVGGGAYKFFKNDSSLQMAGSWAETPIVASGAMVPVMSTLEPDMVFVQSPTNLAMLNTQTMAVTNFSHP